MSAIDEHRRQLRFIAAEALGALSLIADVEKELDRIQVKLARQKKEVTEIYEKIDDALDKHSS